MIGSTVRSRVSFFMNKFRKLGLIDYNGSIEIHCSLLNVVLRDQPQIKGGEVDDLESGDCHTPAISAIQRNYVDCPSLLTMRK
jgi:hypothetical protein